MKKRVLIVFNLIVAAFILSGCNIYRQMVIPTPYYPEKAQENPTLGENPNLVQEEPIKQLPPKSQSKPPQSTITPIKNSNIQVKNRTFVQRIPFPESEYSSLEKTGNAVVKGKIYAILPSGKRVYAKQTRLYLNPVTSYSTQWYKESYLGGAKMSKVDPRLFNYLKFTTSDNQGNFEFLNIPSGSYYLIGVIKCGSECGYVRDRTLRVAKKISVFGDEVKEVELAKKL